MVSRFIAGGRGCPALAACALTVALSWQVAAAQQPQAQGDRMPAPVEGAFRQAFPQAQIVRIKGEPHMLLMYQVEMLDRGQPRKAELFVNGEVLSVARPVGQEELPPRVAQAIARQTNGAPVGQLEQKEIRAIIAISRLPQPQMVYAAQYQQNGRTIVLEVDSSGTVLRQQLADDEDDDDANEREIAIDQVPAAARATILREAAGNRVREVEVQVRNGHTTYEAEWMQNGQEVEVAVAEDGTLLGRHTEADDGDDDEGDDEDEEED